MSTPRWVAAAALGAATLFTACRDRDTIRVQSHDANVAFAKRDSTKPLGPGDLRISSTDSAIDLAIIGDSLVGGFGAKVRAKLAESLDTNKVKSTGFGAS